MAQETKRPLIEYRVVFKPFVDAAALSASSYMLTSAFNGPAVKLALLGGAFSLGWYWVCGNISRPKKKRSSTGFGRSIPVNSVNESRNVRIFDQTAPGYITRETGPEIFIRWVRGKPRHRIKSPMIDKPDVLKEFVFRSQGMELLDRDVRLFLKSAWRNRDMGSGLSERRWVRNRVQRPQWYKDLGTPWYYAFVGLLREAQQITQRQLVIEMGPQWYGLKFEPHETFGALKWAEAQKGS